MTNSKTLINNLKRELKRQKIGYADLAERLDISVSTVKKMLAKGNFTLERLDLICEVINVEYLELIENVNEEVIKVSKLTHSQEQAMVEDPLLLLMGYATINYWSMEDIVYRYKIPQELVINRLKKLEKFGILELRANNNIRPLVSNGFDWRPDGPILKFIRKHMIPEFFKDDFRETGALQIIKNRALTDKSKKILERKSLELADLFDELAYQDRHYLAGNRDRKGTTMVIAYRSWTLSAWGALAREESN
jgi:transcriptional regulator with XRE-family HTH domain